jgi:hypothetical protein
MSVKRYAMEIEYRPGQPAGMEFPDPVLAENEAGNLVLFSDYEALRQAALAVVNSMDYDSDAPLIRELQEAAK